MLVKLWSSFVQTAVFSLVCFVSSVFRLFVYKLMRLTMPVCVLSCAYCCHCVSVPRPASTRRKVETITTEHSALYLHWLDPAALPVAFNTHSSSSPLHLRPLQQRLLGLSCQDKAGCAPGLLTGLCENLLLSFS